MSLLKRLFKGKPKTVWELKEQQFILAINSLKTLRVTDRGGMSIDPSELRQQVIEARHRLKYLVRRDWH